MTFLSAYEGFTRVPLGDPDRGYWADLYDHVSQGGRESADRALQGVSLVGNKVQPTPDVVLARERLVLAHIKEWNLDDESGVWPITLASVKRLPDDVFATLLEIVDSADGVKASAKERAAFPGESVGGDPDGERGAGEPVDVPAGSGDVEEARPEA